MAIKGILCTVGGSPKPIIFSLATHKPSVVAFVCSPQTHSEAVEIASKVQADMPADFSYQIIETSDATDLHKSYLAIVEGFKFLRVAHKLAIEEIRVDFTGGTKAMAAAAVLASAPEEYMFCYVGGDLRDKDGKGVVVDGSEKMLFIANPWSILEQPKIDNVLLYATQSQWFAATRTINDLRVHARYGSKHRTMYELWRGLLEALESWDHFQHQDAVEYWYPNDRCKQLGQLAGELGYRKVSEFALVCSGLGETIKRTDKAKAGLPGQGHDPKILDMLANAERRYKEGHYDEAAIRIYRALELCATRRLRFKFNIGSDYVKPSDIPSDVRAKYRAGPNGKIQLGFRKRLELLRDLKDSVGGRMHQDYEKLDVDSRNHNWLIHDVWTLKVKDYVDFRDAALLVLGIDLKDVPRWPIFTELKSAATRGGC